MDDRITIRVDAGPRLPGSAPRIALIVLSAAAFLVVPPIPASIVVALTVAGAIVAPALVWGAILTLGLAQLANPAVPTDARLYAALALVHLLHVLASLSGGIDPRGTLQMRMLVPPLRRFLAIQLPAQVLLGAVLIVGGELPGPTPLAAVVAAAAVVVVVLVVIRLARRP